MQYRDSVHSSKYVLLEHLVPQFFSDAETVISVAAGTLVERLGHLKLPIAAYICRRAKEENTPAQQLNMEG